jgi:hypothetical protein
VGLRRGITFNEGAHLRGTRELCFQMSRGLFRKLDIADAERIFSAAIASLPTGTASSAWRT